MLHPKGSPVIFPCGCSRENNDPPKKTSMSLSSDPEYVSLQGNRDITDRIKDLRWGGIPGLSRWTQHHLQAPYRREGGRRVKLEEEAS